ncbi:MAG TPA: serine hydrolase [Chthonomonadaceae bacterium]|nr:serine hydrolase [Chthonomonadaceae bacterium]
MKRMVQRTLLIVPAAVAFIAVQCVGHAQEKSTASLALPSDAEINKLLTDRIDVDHWGTGIVVGVITPQGRRIFSYGKLDQGDPHPLNGDTVFEIGSVTKVFTSLLLADMVQRGEVALTDPVEKYLPAGVRTPEWKGHKITLVDLATQTSGLPFFPTDLDAVEDPASVDRYTEKQLYAFLSHYELLHDIGVHWEYTNLGVGLLGHALARRAGTDYAGLVHARITGPLGMKSTALTLSPSMKGRFAVGHDTELKPTPELYMPAMAGAGALRSSANDLLTLLAAFLGDNPSPLAPAMPRMLETVRPADDWLLYLGGKQALGWWIIGTGDDRIIAHAGETLGFSCSVAYNPKTHVGVVALTNSPNGGNEVAMHLLRPSYPYSRPGKPGAAPKAHKEITVDPKLFDRYAGKYRAAPNVIIVIARRGDTLTFMSPSYPQVRLHAEGERDYFIAQSGVTLTFEGDEGGRPTTLMLHLPGLPPIPAKRLDLQAQ